MHPGRVAPLTSARPDPRGGLGVRTTNAALRAEALRQLRSQQREWERLLAQHAPGTLPLADFVAPRGFTDGLDLLREAGEDVPSWLYRRGARERTTEGTSGTTCVSLTDLLTDLTKVLPWLDPEPSAGDLAVSAERPQPGAAGHREPRGRGSPAPNPDRTDPGVRIPPEAQATSYASGDGGPRRAGQGGGDLSGKPTDGSHDAVAGDWTVGDRVTARATAVTIRAGSCGTVVGFSGVGGHPLVDVDGSGRVLIRADHLRAEHLECDGDAPPEARSADRPRSSGTTRLSATPRPPPLAAATAPSPPDWFDRQPLSPR